MNFTTTKTQGWQKHCWEWAKNNEPFELHGVEVIHYRFCDELCAAYQYKFRGFQSGSVFVFEPLQPMASRP